MPSREKSVRVTDPSARSISTTRHRPLAVPLLLGHVGPDQGIAERFEVGFVHGGQVAAAHQLGDQFVADVVAESLFDQLQGSPAFADSGDHGVALQLRELVAEPRVDCFARDGDGELGA